MEDIYDTYNILPQYHGNESCLIGWGKIYINVFVQTSITFTRGRNNAVFCQPEGIGWLLSRLCDNRSRPDRHSSREPSQDLFEDFLLLFKMRSLETWMMLSERLKNSFALLTSWLAPSTLFSNQRTFDNIVFLNNQKRNKNKTKQTIRLNAKK